MELADLLAREGYAPKDLPTLLSWARARADALLEDLDPDSPVGSLLEDLATHVFSKSDARDRSLAEAEENIPADLRLAVTAATNSSPQPAAAAEDPVPAVVDDDDDPDAGLGGFTRFGALMRMNRPYPYRDQGPVADEPPAPIYTRVVQRESYVAPSPSPSPDLSATLPLAALGFSAEESGGLVLGIPDDDSGLTALLDPDAAPERVTRASSSAFIDDDDDPPQLVDDDDLPLELQSPDAGPVGLVDDDDELPLELQSPDTGSVGLVDDDDELPLELQSPDAGSLGLLDDDDDELPLGFPSSTVASPIADETIAEPVRTRDTPSMPGLPAIDLEQELGAPVLRHRGPRKRVVELGKPRAGSSGAVPIQPRSAKSSRKPPPPPPPPPRRPAPAREEIEELSRVELIDDLPSYLHDDDDD